MATRNDKIKLAKLEEEGDSLSLHLGESLFRFSGVYPTIVLTMVEGTQNAIDAEAQKVFIGIDLRTREIIILDDGKGATRQKFRQALASIGKGIKSPGSLGRFGLGLISPLNKCRYFTFASHAKGNRNGNVWRFEGAVLRELHSDGKIKPETVDVLPPIPEQFVAVAGQLYARWRTIVHMVDVLDDKMEDAADLDELEGDIRTKLSIGMIQNNTVVYVMLIDREGKAVTREINPIKFTGEKLEPFVHSGEAACGTVTFDLYRALRTNGVRRGTVLVRATHDNYPIPWRDFFAQAMGRRKLPLVKDAFDALGSGYFEGTVDAELITLNEHRTGFEIGPALNALYVAIHAWYLTVGKDLYESEREARREERYHSLGERSLTRLLSNNEFTSLASKLRGILPGVSPIRLPPSGDRPKPKDPRQRGPVEKRPEQDPTEVKPRESPGFSLRFAHEVLPQSTRLWEFNLDEGVLIFNIRHPIWVRLDETEDGKHNARNDRQVMHLQEWLALKLLILLEQYGDPGFDLELARLAIDKEVRFYAPIFIATIK